MATPTPSTPPEPSKPLSEFEKIGHNIYIWTSEPYLSNSPSETPLILLFAWNAAAGKHIAKYTIAYQRLFPTCRILLIRCYTLDIFRRSSAYGPLLKPALVVHEIIDWGDVKLLKIDGKKNLANPFTKALGTKEFDDHK